MTAAVVPAVVARPSHGLRQWATNVVSGTTLAVALLCAGGCREYTGNRWATVPAGTFMMGSPGSELCRDKDEAQRQVTLGHSFAIGLREVTQQEYEEGVGKNPSYFRSCGATCPVEMVSWQDAALYCNALSRAEGFAPCYTEAGDVVSDYSHAASALYDCPGYRLPTEAEWEYAYRAGTTTALYAGDLTACEGGDRTADAIAWYVASSNASTHAAASKTPNDWGLYGMAGNVAEWCHDADAETTTEPSSGPDLAVARVTRGGSWRDEPGQLRAASRVPFGGSASAPLRSSFIGFRCVRTLTGGDSVDGPAGLEPGSDVAILDAPRDLDAGAGDSQPDITRDSQPDITRDSQPDVTRDSQPDHASDAPLDTAEAQDVQLTDLPTGNH